MKSLFFGKHFLSICVLFFALSNQIETHVFVGGGRRTPAKRHTGHKLSKTFKTQLESRGRRRAASGRRLNRKFINGTTLGIGALGAGAYLALKGRKDQKTKIQIMNSALKTMIDRYMILTEQNKSFYRDVDQEMTKLEEQVEDLADTAIQRISDFDLRIRAKVSGKPFMPPMSY